MNALHNLNPSLTGAVVNSPCPATPVCPPAFTERAFRDALGQFATGVTIVTTTDAKGQPVGMTVSSFNSVSLTPPLVLWSLGCHAGSYSAFAQAKHYAIHVLSNTQQALAMQFAQRGVDRFADVRWQPNAQGVPLLEGVLATFECSARSQYAEGDHLIMVGHVLNCSHAPERSPLLYHAGRMR